MNSKKLLITITEKWHIKVLAVAAAIIITVFYRMNTLETRVYSSSLQVIGNEHLLPSNSYTQKIKVNVRGETNDINHIQEEDMEVFIDLEKYQNEGVYKIPVQFVKKGNLAAIEPVEIKISPLYIMVKLERKIVRNIPVSPIIRGSVSDGYELTSQSVTPAYIMAEGPQSNIESLYELNTGIIDLERRYEDFSVIVNIVNNDPLIIIRGNKSIEYRGIIKRIQRNAPGINIGD